MEPKGKDSSVPLMKHDPGDIRSTSVESKLAVCKMVTRPQVGEMKQ